MIGAPFLMWQGQTHATASGHFSSVYDLAWPESSKDHSDMLSSIIFCRTCWRDSIFLWFMNKDHSILPKLVPEVYGLHPHAAYRAKKKQISDFFPFRYFAGGWCLSFTCTKPWKGAAVNFFVWQFSIETFPCSMPALQNLTHQPKAPFTSQGSQDLVKLLPHWGSFTFRL